MIVPFTLLDYTHPLARYSGQPYVTQGSYYQPSYEARKTPDGADAYLDGAKVATFPSMEEACRFVMEQSAASDPWRRSALQQGSK